MKNWKWCILALGLSVFVQGIISADELDAKIGQMLMVGFRGFELEEGNPIIADIVERNIGGVILFDIDVAGGRIPRNIQSPEQVLALNESLQALASTPLLIAVDQEGGTIRRLKPDHGFGPTVSHQAMGDRNDLAFTQEKSADIADMVFDHGFNFNLAPVVDVNINPESPAIGALGRSFSEDPSEVARHAFEYIAAHRNRGVLTALKHFPGHGSAENDSHLGFTDVTETWQPIELEPYEELIASGVADVVMTAHVFHGELDSEYPATLSANIIGGILRGTLGFDGVVISDDMNMDAIAEHYTVREALKLSINAGVDLLVFANNLIFDPEIAGKAIGMIREMVDDGEISEARIHESYERIQRLKAKMGLTPVERWRTAHFSETERNDPAISSDEATPAGDGVPNLVKYFTGTNPFENLALELRPWILLKKEPVLRFGSWAPATDLTVEIEVSEDLKNWRSAEGVFEENRRAGETRFFDFRENDENETSGSSQRFYRLRLER